MKNAFFVTPQYDKMCLECQRIKFQWKKVKKFHICLRSGLRWLIPPPLTVSLTVKYPLFFWRVALLDVRSRALQHISQSFVSLWWAEIILKAWWIKEQPIKLSPYQRSPFSRVALVLQFKSSKTTLLREKFFLTWKWIIALDVLTNKRERGGESLQVWVGKGTTGSTFKHKFVLKCN